MASIQVFKVLMLLMLFNIVGCKTLPNFPILFMSHQDLLDQTREIDGNKKGEAD